MQNTTYIALSRQTSLWRQMDMIANNMANVNTTGYKREEPLFVEYLTKIKNPENKATKNVSFVQDYGTVRDFSSGSLTTTGNTLDVALNEDSFFVVETPEGERFTKNGRFKLDEQGRLVSSSGDPVLSTDGQPFYMAPNETDIEIANDGTLSTENGVIGKIRVVRFEDIQKLNKTHNSLYQTRADNQPVEVQNPQVFQGMLEESNVQPVLEMTRMIQLQRTYNNVQKMIDNEHERMQRAIDTIAQTPR